MLTARLLVFSLAFGAGIGCHSTLKYFTTFPKEEGFATGYPVDRLKHLEAQSNDVSRGTSGTGAAFCYGTSRGPLETELPGEQVKSQDTPFEKPDVAKVTNPLKITYKQKAEYTAEARANGIEGTVTLRVTFLASGGIGGITTLRGLPFGLTEQAIEAARKLRFEPEVTDHGPRTTTRPVAFTFNIY